MSRGWSPLQIDLREAPALNATGRRRVATMLTFSQTPANAFKIDYDNIVTDENMRKVLKYHIPSGKVWYDKKRKTLVWKTGSEVAATPRVKASGVAPGPRKSVKPKTVAPQPRKVSKSTTIPKAIVIHRGDHASTVLAKSSQTRERVNWSSRTKDADNFCLNRTT
jgi:hypothetical protein